MNMRMNLNFSKANHIGDRDQQQDRVDIFPSPTGDACLLVVADGMGGHKGGELAAQIVINTAQEMSQQFFSTPSHPPKFLHSTCTLAHQRINDCGKEQGITPRSTGVFLLIINKTAHWIHVGDCRLYHFRKAKLLHRTLDHSVVQMLVNIGKVRAEDMGNHPDQNRVLASIGGDKIGSSGSSVEINLFNINQLSKNQGD